MAFKKVFQKNVNELSTGILLFIPTIDDFQPEVQKVVLTLGL